MADSAPVVVTLQVDGVKDVQNALKSVEKTIEDLEKRSVQLSGASGRTKIRNIQDLAKVQENMAKRAIRADEAASRAAIREAERTSKAKMSAEERVTKAKEKASQDARKTADKTASYEIRAAERAAEQASRQADRAAKAYERAQERKLSSLQRSLAAEDRAMAQAERKKADSSANFRKTVGGKVGSSVSGALGGAVKLAGLATSVAGGFTVADAVQNETRARGMAADIANSGSTAQKGQFTSKQVMTSARSAAARYGIADEEALGGLSKFTSKTGELQRGMELLPQLAELSRATGASLADMADAAGDAFSADTTQNAEQVMSIMRALAAQGKLGAVEIKDLATQMAKVSSSASKFKGDPQEMVQVLGGFAQVARQSGGASSAEEAATSVQRLSSDLGSNKKKFDKLGVKVMDGKVYRDPREIIKNVLQKTGGNEAQITDLFGERSARVVSGFADTYRKAESVKKGSGAAAVDAQMKQFGGATMTKQDVTASAGKRMEEADAQFAQVMNSLKAEMGEQLLPELIKLVPVLKDATPHIRVLLSEFVKLTQWVMKNPMQSAFLGLGAVAAKSLATELAASGLKSMLANGLGGPITSLGGKLGALGGIAAAAGVAIALGMEHIQGTIDSMAKRQGGESLKGGDIGNERLSLTAKIRDKTATQADVDKAKQYLTSGQADVTAMKNKTGAYAESNTEKGLGYLAQYTNAMTLGVVGGGIKDAEKTKAAAHDASAKRAQDSLNEFAKTLEAATKAVQAQTDGKANPNSPARSGNSLASPARN